MRIAIPFVIVNLLALVQCKKILGIYSHPGKSHQVIGEVILKKLAERGHEVTMVSAFPLKKPHPNYTDIYLDGLIEDLDTDDDIYLEMEKNSILNFFGAFQLVWHFANKTFGHPAMQKLIKSGEKFDLIIMDWFCKDSELFYGNIFEAPVIITTSFGTQTGVNYLVGNPEPYSYVPVSGFTYTDEMNFFERLGNTIALIFVEGIILYNKIMHKRILDSNFANAPTIDEVRGNLDLILTNAHPVLETPRPYVPNIVSIGGIHVQEPEPLPKDLQEFLDGSPNGVVYFSLGSHMKTSALPGYVINSILNGFSRLSQNVLMKWETDDSPTLPSNVRTRKWMPQNSILAHPNTKVFITHGGLMGKIEAIYHAVPMLGIPLFGDQPTNVAHNVHEGTGLKLLLSEISEDSIYHTLTEITNNSSYSQNIKKKSLLLRDQPMKPIDTAIYWAEFVMTHNGSKHLQNKGVRLNRFQYLLLDVVAFIVGVILSVILALVIIIRKLYSLGKQVLIGDRGIKKSHKKIKKK